MVGLLVLSYVYEDCQKQPELNFIAKREVKNSYVIDRDPPWC